MSEIALNNKNNESDTNNLANNHSENKTNKCYACSVEKADACVQTEESEIGHAKIDWSSLFEHWLNESKLKKDMKNANKNSDNLLLYNSPKLLRKREFKLIKDELTSLSYIYPSFIKLVIKPTEYMAGRVEIKVNLDEISEPDFTYSQNINYSFDYPRTPLEIKSYDSFSVTEEDGDEILKTCKYLCETYANQEEVVLFELITNIQVSLKACHEYDNYLKNAQSLWKIRQDQMLNDKKKREARKIEQIKQSFEEEEARRVAEKEMAIQTINKMVSNNKTSSNFEVNENDISSIKKSRISSFRTPILRSSTINMITENKEEDLKISPCNDVEPQNDNEFVFDKEHTSFGSRFYSDFEEVEYVSEGGFGEVFKARNKVDKNVYAIKKMILNYDHEDEVRKLIQEAQTLSKLNHENIVRYYQAWTESIPEAEMSKIVERLENIEESSSENSSVHSFYEKKSLDYYQNKKVNKKFDQLISSDGSFNFDNNLLSIDNKINEESQENVYTNSNLTQIKESETSENIMHEVSMHFQKDNKKFDKYFQEVSVSESEPSNKIIPVKKQNIESVFNKPQTYFQNVSITESEASIQSDTPTHSDDCDNNPSDESDSYTSSQRSLKKVKNWGNKMKRQLSAMGKNLKTDELDCEKKFEESNKKTIKTKSNAVKKYQNMKYLFIQMEYCELETLTEFDIHQTSKKLNDCNEIGTIEKIISNIIRQICDALQFIHSKGIIHRDLKPSNIFQDANLNIKQGDFGLATKGAGLHSFKEQKSINQHKHNDTKLHNQNTLSYGMGTPLYMSPEQAFSGRYNTKSDMYSLGIILFEIMYENKNFKTQMQKIKMQENLTVNSKFPDDFGTNFKDKLLLTEYQDLVLQLVNKDPKKRPFADKLFAKYRDDMLHQTFINDVHEYKKLIAFQFSKKNIFPSNYDNLYSFSKIIDKSLKLNQIEGKSEHMIQNSTTNYFNCSKQLLAMKDTFMSIFKCHNAIQSFPNIYIPFYDSYTIHMYQPTITYDQNLNIRTYKTMKVNRVMPRNALKYIGNRGQIIEKCKEVLVPWVRNISRKNYIKNISSFFFKISSNMSQDKQFKNFSNFDVYYATINQRSSTSDFSEEELICIKTAESIQVSLDCILNYKHCYNKAFELHISHSVFFDIICFEFRIFGNEQVTSFAIMIKQFYEINRNDWEKNCLDFFNKNQTKFDRLKQLLEISCDIIQDENESISLKSKFISLLNFGKNEQSHFIFEEIENIMYYINEDILDKFDIKYDFFTPYIDDFKYHSGVLFWVGINYKKTQSQHNLNSSVKNPVSKPGIKQSMLLKGGRIDNLISHFSDIDEKRDVYGIGIEINGVNLLEKKIDFEKLKNIYYVKESGHSLFVISKNSLIKEKIEVATKFRKIGWKVSYNTNSNFEKHKKIVDDAKKHGFTCIAFLKAAKTIKIKQHELNTGNEVEYDLQEFFQKCRIFQPLHKEKFIFC